jgi:hypothetical protein
VGGQEYALWEWDGDGGARRLSRHAPVVGVSDPFLSSMEETMVGAETRRPQRRPLGYLGALACILTVPSLGACANAGHGERTPSPVANRVVVRNYKWDRLTVYLAGRGAPTQLGVIEGLAEETFPVPRWALASVDEIYLVARPVAASSFRSESFVFRSGATVVWTVGNQTAMSYVVLH